MDQALGRQPRHLAAVLTGNGCRRRLDRARRTPAGWQQAIAFVSDGRGARSGVVLEPAGRRAAPWHPGRCAEFVRSTGG